MAIASNNGRQVCLVGVGACTPLGLNALSSAAAVRAGISAFAEHPFMIDQDGERMIVARASYLPDGLIYYERLARFAVSAAKEAVTSLQATENFTVQLPVIIGLPSKRPGIPGNLNSQVAEHFRIEMEAICRITNVEVIAAGHSAGLIALEAGWNKIRQGVFEFCLVGGVDSYLEPETLEWVEACEQLHSSTNAYGFIPGEAGGFCLISSRQAAERLKLTILGEILSVASAREKNLIKTETVCIGEGLSKAFKQALQPIISSGIKVDYVICDMNGEPYRADEYGFTIARLSDCFLDAGDFSTPADCWGDVGAASGPLFVNFAAASKIRGYAKGSKVLAWTSSEGGERSAALIDIGTER